MPWRAPAAYVRRVPWAATVTEGRRRRDRGGGRERDDGLRGILCFRLKDCICFKKHHCRSRRTHQIRNLD
jgi:hypothetical protein